MTLVLMSRTELSRIDVLERLARRELRVAQAAAMLDLDPRHLLRLRARYAADGSAGLASKKRGRASNNRLPETLRAEVLRLVREHYLDFGPTFAAEKLAECHGLHVSRETLRQLMIAEGLWAARQKKYARIHQPRHRRDCLGELVQIDGSLHLWFETRGPKCTLLVFIDDATSRLMPLMFAPAETALAYMAATKAYIESHGKPVAFYSDKHGIFRVATASAERLDGMSQFGRALHSLDIEIICAHSPQAKGRVERANGTLQDRLVKELRLAGISTIDAANAWLPSFIERHNRRFAKPPAQDTDLHRPLARHDDLDSAMTWREERGVTRALTLHYNKMVFLLAPTALSRSLIRKRVTVCEHPDGRLTIRHNGVALAYSSFDKIRQVNQAAIVDNKRLGAALAMAREIQAQMTPRKRNNNEPVRSAQPTHMFAVPAPLPAPRKRGRPPLPKRPPALVTQ